MNVYGFLGKAIGNQVVGSRYATAVLLCIAIFAINLSLTTICVAALVIGAVIIGCILVIVMILAITAVFAFGIIFFILSAEKVIMSFMDCVVHRAGHDDSKVNESRISDNLQRGN